MRRIAMSAFIALACIAAAGCIAPPQGEPHAQTPAPPIAGTLYVFHTSTSGQTGPVVEILHDGKHVANAVSADVLIARDKPSVRLSTKPLFGAAPNDARSCEPIAISADGTWAACLRSDGRGTLTVFKLADPQHSQHTTDLHVSVNSRRMAGFVGHALAAAADDNSCPQFYRTDAHFSFEPRARLFVIDMRGKRLRKGPCIHGLVAGEHKLAYIGHDTTEKPFYSFDGTTWSPGLAMTFDGGDHLLVINPYDQLIDDQGRLVSDDAVDAWWTR